MPNVPDWRSETAPLKQLERPGFAWEFLRRNQKYIADYERIMRAGNFDKPDVANAAANIARHWGLNCTAGPKTPSHPSNGALASGSFTNHRHSYARARRFWQSRHARSRNACRSSRGI
jgi:hypothetical protein